MDMEHAALLIIDMQNDFIHPDGFVRKSSRGIGLAEDSLELLTTPIPFIKQLSHKFRATGRQVIYVHTAWQPDYSDIALPLKKMGQKAREHGALVVGSWGAQIIDELTPEKGDLMLLKKAYGAFFQTSLDRTLRNRKITTLFFTGVATNYCVETTAREAVAYGYDIVLIKDGCATFDPAGHEATLKVISMGFGEVMTTEEVLNIL
jgi:ureidoacrylate peracid hydrolase